MENINNLLQFVTSIKSKYDEITKITGENYNIFHLLDIGHLENYHSKIIADLLNPKGLHNQGNIFLKLFLDNFSIDTIDIDTAQVFTEHVIDNSRRIDIYLKDNKNQNIIIENKIYAGEQNQQLSDYQKYGKKQNENSKLLFLTLWGSKSNQHNKLEKLGNYSCISYQTDIIKWLELCKKESANQPILRETLTQYIFLVKSLTHQNQNSKMANEITKFLTQDNEKLKDFFQIYDSYMNVINSLIGDFSNQMYELADELGVEYDKSNFSEKIYTGFSFHIVNEEFRKISLRFEFQMSNYMSLGFGINGTMGKDKTDKDFEQNLKLYSEIDENFRKYFTYCKSSYINKRSDSWEKFGWLNFGYSLINNRALFLAIKNGEMKAYIKDILENAIRIVKETIDKN